MRLKLTIGTIIIALMLGVGISYKTTIDQKQAAEERIAINNVRGSREQAKS